MLKLSPTPNQTSRQHGSVIVGILSVMIFLTSLLFALVVLANADISRARTRIYALQAQYAAESGADAAIAYFNSGNDTYAGTSSDITVLSTAQYKATFSSSVAAGSDLKEKLVTAVGKVYAPSTATTPTYTRTIRVTVQRTSTTSASSIMSRNIIDVDSSVKSVSGKEVYLNGFLNVRSNATDFITEKLTVAGKDTGAANCSIEGSGHLVRASTLPAGTKAVIKTAFNNCINPPGNISTSNFDVSANNSSITQIGSIYIPWSQYMDGSYQNSPTGCNDWLQASPATIPSTGNTKKTHYPNSSSGVASSCGTSGNIDLGSKTFNVADNVHLRANLCATSACAPTFNNTSGSIKYIFIEGTINFASVQTAAGSSPMVFITYGADPGTHGSCPYGDSVFINKNGSTGTNAPAIYFLAASGVCLYQTKFDASPALGGIGGKNLYISSNSGTPFYLSLDPNFPVSQIPIDLAWRAVRYERL